MSAKTQHPDPSSLCCESMRAPLQSDCEEHDNPFDRPDGLLACNEELDQFALIVHDGERQVVLIRFFPWCGASLQEGTFE